MASLIHTHTHTYPSYSLSLTQTHADGEASSGRRAGHSLSPSLPSSRSFLPPRPRSLSLSLSNLGGGAASGGWLVKSMASHGPPPLLYLAILLPITSGAAALEEGWTSPLSHAHTPTLSRQPPPATPSQAQVVERLLVDGWTSPLSPLPPVL